jgi:hypothetical protein
MYLLCATVGVNKFLNVAEHFSKSWGEIASKTEKECVRITYKNAVQFILISYKYEQNIKLYFSVY